MFSLSVCAQDSWLCVRSCVHRHCLRRQKCIYIKTTSFYIFAPSVVVWKKDYQMILILIFLSKYLDINIYFPLDLPNSMFYWCKQENRYVRSLRHCWLDAGWEAGKRQAGCCSYNYLRRSVFHSKPAIITSHQDRNTSSVSS